MSKKNTIQDPIVCNELSKPFADDVEMNAAFQAFRTEMSELRAKHKIPDVVCVIQGLCIRDGEQREAGIYFHHGDSRNVLPMLAVAFGRESQTHAVMIADLIRGKQ